jgi:hypothetical protein
MRFFRTSILVLVILAAGAAIGFAQTASDSHDVNITIGNVFTLEVSAPGTAVALTTSAPPAGSAGLPVVGDTDSSKDLYYTLLSGAVQSIQASINTNIVPATVGYRLDLLANVLTGAHGTSSGTVVLSTTPTDIIDTISSVATTQTNGVVPSLTYTLVVTDSALLTPSTPTYTVTLTLTQL